MLNNLPTEWKFCFGLARKAFDNGSYPVGCLVTNTDGKFISWGYASMVYNSSKSNMTQHAEMMALAQIPLPSLEQDLILYSTVEPCPMCFGAINVARISEVHYATRDPWSGSINLKNGNWYMKRKEIKLVHDNYLEQIFACWLVSMNKDNIEFVDRWKIIVPNIEEIIDRFYMIKPGLFPGNDSDFFDLLHTTIFGEDKQIEFDLSNYAGNLEQLGGTE